MAIKQGRCPNCGSILMVDDQAAEGICIFCQARYVPAQAEQLDQDPGDHEFKNEPQPELTDEERRLAFSAYGNVHVPSAAASAKKTIVQHKKKPVDQLTPAQRVALMKKELVEPKLSRRHQLYMAAIIVGVILISVAVILPLTLSKQAKRAELAAEINQIAGFEVADPAYYAFSGQRNQSLLLIYDGEVTEETAADVLAQFKQARSQVYKIDPDNQQKSTVLRLTGTNGSIIIHGDGDTEVEANSAAAGTTIEENSEPAESVTSSQTEG
ncbi:hypothetical protein HCH52_06625 [Oscillospiraceae bacterium HV4-5-C5C]|nr:hypothetical protein [Oscillospiraceae bacterium HV4-5-C5C]